MENKTTVIAIAVSAIVSAALTTTTLKMSAEKLAPEASSADTIESQLVQLRSDLAFETQARISLQQQISDIQSSSGHAAGQQQSARQPTPTEQNATGANQTEVNGEESQLVAFDRIREQRRAERLARQQPDYREQQLVAAGFANEEAARIVQIESEESLRQLQAQYDFRRARSQENGDTQVNINPIRAELGDQNYERYLEANGWPTSAQVGSVIGGSPGESAGLRAGDNITSYAGERVFNLNEINNLTVRGDVGESVLIEVDRNGESVQLTIPRGPIGINGGRRRFRR